MEVSAPHIAILCSYLHVPGGYEKAVVTLANLFCEKGHPVTLVILDKDQGIFYPLDPRVSIVQQPLSFGITEEGNVVSRKVSLLGDVLKLRSLLKKLAPNHVIATEYPFAAAAVLSGAGKRMKIYLWEHHHYGAVKKNTFWNYISEKAFRRLDAMVCLNQDERDHYATYNENARVIPNFIAPAAGPLPAYESQKQTDLLSVTRFNAIKGIDLLMEVAKRVLKPNPSLSWKVIGYGVQEDELKEFVRNEGLEQQLIIQAARHTDISREYQQASLLVMTSRNECFPLVLLEAMSNGLPAVSFDCDTGPRHIIRQHRTGMLTPAENPDLLAEAILALLNDPGKRKEMSLASRKEAEHYYPDAVYKLWKELLATNPDNYRDE